MVIVFGEGNFNTLGVLHELQAVGIEALLLIVGKAKDRHHGNIIGYSRYATNVVEVPSFGAGYEWLAAHRREFAADTVVYPTSDIAEKLLDCHYDELRPTYRFPNVGKQEGVSRLMDKHLQTDLAASAGVTTIRSQYSNDPSFDYSAITYPCMVKPLNSTSGSKCDMRVCRNEAEVREALSHGSQTHEFIVQQYIENEADLLFLGSALESGEVWIPAVVVKPGVSAVGEYTHAIVSTDVKRYLPEMEVVKKFIRGLGFSGPFSIEFCHEKGVNYFLEINLRNDGTSHYPLNAGVNIAEAYVTARIPAATKLVEYEMIDEVSDMRRVLNREISLRSWLRSFRNAGAYRFYRKGDHTLLLPLLYMFVVRSADKLKRIIAKA